MKRHVQILVVLYALIQLISSCASPKKTFDKNSNGWLPNDFNPKIGVLIIEESWPKRQQSKIAEFMKNKYPYKYEFVSRKDIEQKLSSNTDKNVNRFALVNSFNSHTMNYMQSNQMNITLLDYHFIDLLNKKDFPRSGIPSSWASMTFIEIINKVLHDKG